MMSEGKRSKQERERERGPPGYFENTKIEI